VVHEIIEDNRIDFVSGPCPHCGAGRGRGKRHSVKERVIRCLGSSTSSRKIHLTYPVYKCKSCQRHFTNIFDLVRGRHQYAHEVISLAKRLYWDAKTDRSLEDVSAEMLHKYHMDLPATTLHNWLNGL
jgi:transposase